MNNNKKATLILDALDEVMNINYNLLGLYTRAVEEALDEIDLRESKGQDSLLQYKLDFGKKQP